VHVDVDGCCHGSGQKSFPESEGFSGYRLLPVDTRPRARNKDSVAGFAGTLEHIRIALEETGMRDLAVSSELPNASPAETRQARKLLGRRKES